MGKAGKVPFRVMVETRLRETKEQQRVRRTYARARLKALAESGPPGLRIRRVRGLDWLCDCPSCGESVVARKDAAQQWAWKCIECGLTS